MSILRLCLFMLCLPSLAMAQAGSLFPDEAPAVARLLDDGLAAQALGSEAGAEARFCAAARLGSVEGQYRLGRFYLEERPARRGGRNRDHAVVVCGAADIARRKPARHPPRRKDRYAFVLRCATRPDRFAAARQGDLAARGAALRRRPLRRDASTPVWCSGSLRASGSIRASHWPSCETNGFDPAARSRMRWA